MAGLRVLVADAAVLVCTGIKSVLAQQEDIECIGEARTALEAVEMSETLLPDVVILGHNMPDLDAVEAVRLIKQCRPKAEVIVLADELDRDEAFRCLAAGAASYILKDIEPANLMRAVEAVCHGRTVMHPAIMRHLVEHVQASGHEADWLDGLHVEGLTVLELRIVLEMTRGATDREIARKLYMSTASAKSAIRTIFRKVGAQTRTQAVVHILTRHDAAAAAG